MEEGELVMSSFMPGGDFLYSLKNDPSFQFASQQTEIIQNIKGSLQPLFDSGAAGRIRDLTASLRCVNGTLGQLKFGKPEVLMNLQRQIDMVECPADLTA